MKTAIVLATLVVLLVATSNSCATPQADASWAELVAHLGSSPTGTAFQAFVETQHLRPAPLPYLSNSNGSFNIMVEGPTVTTDRAITRIAVLVDKYRGTLPFNLNSTDSLNEVRRKLRASLGEPTKTKEGYCLLYETHHIGVYFSNGKLFTVEQWLAPKKRNEEGRQQPPP